MTPEPLADAACTLDGGCITCGDVALPLTAVEAGETDARCRDDEGRTELVALELVGPLAVGDRVLVHAGVALERLQPASAQDPATGERIEHALR